MTALRNLPAGGAIPEEGTLQPRWWIVGEAALIVVAWGLGYLTGVTPWATFDWQATGLLWGLLATLPLLAGMAWMVWARPCWLRPLLELLDRWVAPLLARLGFFETLLLALLAGVGEELLFRGALQPWLALHLGTAWGLVLASLAFGGLHALNRGYFVLATLAGLYLGVCWLVTGNLLVPIVAHAAYDLVAIRYLVRLHLRGELMPARPLCGPAEQAS